MDKINRLPEVSSKNLLTDIFLLLLRKYEHFQLFLNSSGLFNSLLIESDSSSDLLLFTTED